MKYVSKICLPISLAIFKFDVRILTSDNIIYLFPKTGVLPGECWAFKGTTGNVVIQLLGPVHVSGVSLEHIPQSISPLGETSTAPKDFSIWVNSIFNSISFII